MSHQFMNCLSFLVRLALAAFVCITAYQNLQNLPSSSKTLLDNYKNFQNTFTQKTNIKFHEKKLGQLFCDESAQQIIDMLLLECSKANVILKKDSMHYQFEKMVKS